VVRSTRRRAITTGPTCRCAEPARRGSCPG